MLKYIRQHMTSIEGIEIYPMISLVIFVSFFVGVIIWVYTSNKETIKEISNYPLED